MYNLDDLSECILIDDSLANLDEWYNKGAIPIYFNRFNKEYNRDYYCDTFDRDYPLEEDIIYSNKRKLGQTWICGDKYKIYPQHIPGVECHVPGIKASNIFGMGYSKSTAVSIKGDYNKKKESKETQI